jgi:hypothetical protein
MLKSKSFELPWKVDFSNLDARWEGVAWRILIYMVKLI